MSDHADPAPPVPSPTVTPLPPAAPRQWAAPGAPPFGTPAAPPVHPAYAPPPGYTGPYLQSPAAAGYRAPAGASADSRGSRLGLVALIAALGAAVLAPIGGAVAAFNIGLGTGQEIALGPMDIDFDWSVLTPVRDWVLLAEISFWTGTVLGVWAIVQGIIAVVTHRGRRAGIAAVAVAVLGAIIFGAAVQGFLTLGFASGSGIGG